jgi:hypothetical protein
MDEASLLSTLEHLRAGTHAISLRPAVSPSGQPLTTDERQGMGAGAALTSRAVGGRLRARGMAVMPSSDLDQRA